MSTRINITVGPLDLDSKVIELQKTARLAYLEKQRRTILEDLGAQRFETATAAETANKLGQDTAAFDDSRGQGDPALFYSSKSHYWLAARSWLFDGYSFNGVEKKTTVRIVGAEGTVSYDTFRNGGYSVLNLLNGTDSSSDILMGPDNIPYLPEGTIVPTSPYISSYVGDGLDKARKTLEDAASGLDETDPAEYILHHDNQLPVFDGEYARFYKPFYNVYYETLDNSKITAFATEPKKIGKSGTLKANATLVNHGKTLEADNSSLFSAYHVYLAGKYEAGPTTIRPADATGLNLRDVHVFVDRGRQRVSSTTNTNGFYFLYDSGTTSRFAVGDVVYLNNYSLTFSEPQLYRYGTIIEISRGSFTYDNAPPRDSNPRVETGLRIIVRLSTPLTLDPLRYHRLFKSTIVKMFPSIEEALTSQDAFWVDYLRNLGGYNNSWVTRTLEGEELGVPSLAAAFVGNSSLRDYTMDCSKDGKAYFIQSVYIEKADPPWRRQVNYHDGDTVAQRIGREGIEELVKRSVYVRFFELDCARNRITNSFTTEQSVTDQTIYYDDTYPATLKAMPDWFPSKRYRLAGYDLELNLNKTETIASRRSSLFDTSTQTMRYYIKSWPIDPTLPIEELNQMVYAEADATEIEITDTEGEMERDIAESAGGGGWGYSGALNYFVSG